jgi:hypothetical protein
VVSGDKGALSRLSRSTNEFLGEKLRQCRIELCLWIGFPIGRHEKSRVILFTGIAPEKIFSIVKQKVPFTFSGKLDLPTIVDQVGKIGILGRLARSNWQGWKESQSEKQQNAAQAAGQKDTGPRPYGRSPVLVISEL